MACLCVSFGEYALSGGAICCDVLSFCAFAAVAFCGPYVFLIMSANCVMSGSVNVQVLVVSNLDHHCLIGSHVASTETEELMILDSVCEVPYNLLQRGFVICDQIGVSGFAYRRFDI